MKGSTKRPRKGLAKPFADPMKFITVALPPGTRVAPPGTRVAPPAAPKMDRVRCGSGVGGFSPGPKDCPHCGTVTRPRVDGGWWTYRCPKREYGIRVGPGHQLKMRFVHADECNCGAPEYDDRLPDPLELYGREYAEQALADREGEPLGPMDDGRTAEMKAALATGAQWFVGWELEPVEPVWETWEAGD